MGEDCLAPNDRNKNSMSGYTIVTPVRNTNKAVVKRAMYIGDVGGM